VLKELGVFQGTPVAKATWARRGSKAQGVIQVYRASKETRAQLVTLAIREWLGHQAYPV